MNFYAVSLIDLVIISIAAVISLAVLSNVKGHACIA